METINNSETQNLNPIVPQKNIFKILFIVLLGLFLIVLLLIIFLLINNKKTIPQSQNQTTENISITPTVTTETSNWKKYTDSHYKYSINYPSDWVLKNKSTNSISLSSMERDRISKQDPMAGPNIIISVYDSLSELSNSSDTKTLEEFVNNTVKDSINKNIKKLIIDNVSGFSTITDYPSKIVYFQKGNLFYSIYSDSIEDNGIEQQIINTIKFI